jgi:integrase
MENIKLVLDTRRKSKNNKYPLSLYVYSNGTARFISLKHHFTKEEYKVINRNQTPRTIEFNNKMNDLLMNAIQIKSTLKPFDFGRFKKLLNNKSQSNLKIIYLKDIFDDVIKLKEKNGNVKTAISYKHAISSLSKFMNPIRIEDITPDFLTNYQHWYVKNHSGKLNASVGMVLRNLRAVINKLKSDNQLPADYQYPFGRNKYQIKNVRKPKRTLTKEEIETLVNLDEFTCDEERKARDLWLMQFYCNGINLKDLLLLKWEDKLQSLDGDGDYFVIKRQKTKSTNNTDRFIRIPIIPQLINLIDKYGDKNSPYVLGLMQEGMDEYTILNKKEFFGKFINRHLNKISKRMNFSIQLSTKVARDAYATTLRRNGVSIEVISQNLGHSSVLITMHYLEDFGFDVITNANKFLP